MGLLGFKLSAGYVFIFRVGSIPTRSRQIDMKKSILILVQILVLVVSLAGIIVGYRMDEAVKVLNNAIML